METTILEDAWIHAKDLKDTLGNLVAATAKSPLGPASLDVYHDAIGLFERLEGLEERAEGPDEERAA